MWVKAAAAPNWLLCSSPPHAKQVLTKEGLWWNSQDTEFMKPGPWNAYIPFQIFSKMKWVEFIHSTLAVRRNGSGSPTTWASCELQTELATSFMDHVFHWENDKYSHSEWVLNWHFCKNEWIKPVISRKAPSNVYYQWWHSNLQAKDRILENISVVMKKALRVRSVGI